MVLPVVDKNVIGNFMGIFMYLQVCKTVNHIENSMCVHNYCLFSNIVTNLRLSDFNNFTRKFFS